MKKLICVFVAFCGLFVNLFAAGGNFMNEKENVRIQNFLAKVRRGEPVTVAVLGGSITTGYNAQPISKNSWASRTETWLKDLAAKNKCELKFLNEGVSGTDSEKVPLQCFQMSRSGYYGWAYRELVKGDKVQKYTVHVQCSKRAPKSQAGKPCNITGILAAGKTK